MKKLVFLLALMLVGFTMKAQQQYTGWYTQPPNPADIVVNTAITNFESGKMLKIDTYLSNSGSGVYYFELTFINDFFVPIVPSIRYDMPAGARIVMINDVKYDNYNDCYIACGYLDYNGKGSLLIKFDNAGNIMWQISGWNYNLQSGANEYRRVEVCQTTTFGTRYAACGYGTSGISKYGVVAFYDLSGGFLSMYRPDPSSTGDAQNTIYNDIVFNTLNNNLGLVGNFSDLNVRIGYLYELCDLTPFTPTALPITIKGGAYIEATSIEVDLNNPPNNYYITGDILYNTLYVNQTDLNGADNEFIFNFNNITDLKVEDNCITNNPVPMLSITGKCNSNFGLEGFVAEINVSNFNVNNFSIWSGNQPPNFLPFNDAYFQHIVYRNNNAVTPNYSYILYGMPIIPSPYPFIAEFYPNPLYSNCHDSYLNGNGNNYNLPLYNVSVLQLYDYDHFPNFNISYPNQSLNNGCNVPPFYSTVNHQRKLTSINNTDNDRINANSNERLALGLSINQNPN